MKTKIHAWTIIGEGKNENGRTPIVFCFLVGRVVAQFPGELLDSANDTLQLERNYEKLWGEKYNS